MPRELCLNELSLPHESSDQTVLDRALGEMAKSLAMLVQRGVAEPVIRLPAVLYEVQFCPGATFYDVLAERRSRPEFTELVRFLFRLSQKVPFCQDISGQAQERLFGCEGKNDSGKSPGLLLCALAKFIAVSFPTSPRWRNPTIQVEVEEFNSEADIITVLYNIDNVSSQEHARSLADKESRAAAERLTTGDFWNQKASVFAGLGFGLDVKAQVESLDEQTFQLVSEKLSALAEAARFWAISDMVAPRWKTKVSPESSSDRVNPKVIAARTFLDQAGVSRFFEWHARYGSGGRIHIYLDAVRKVVVVGYIGTHLFLPS